MSFYRFFTCDLKLDAYDNTGTEMFSRDQAIEKGYNISELWRALDNEDMFMVVDDENQMNNLQVIPQDSDILASMYSKKRYISLVAMIFDEERSQDLINYIRNQIQIVKEMKLWVLLLDQDTEVIKKTISIDKLCHDVLVEYFIYDDGRYPRCLTITSN